MTRLPGRWIGALACLAAGLLAALYAAQNLPRRIARMQRKVRTLTELDALEAQAARELAAVKLYETLVPSGRTSLQDLLKAPPAGFGTAQASLQPGETTALLNDWLREDATVDLPSATPDQIEQFFLRSYEARPPWTVRALEIRATSATDGTVDLRLAMSCIHKQDAR